MEKADRCPNAGGDRPGRAAGAKTLFLEGYNCSQAVFCAFGDVTGLDRDTSARLASSFGGGLGRLREVCGAVSGAAMVLGAAKGYADPKDAEAKKEHYERVREFAGRFRDSEGSILCRELLAGAKPGGSSAAGQADPGRAGIPSEAGPGRAGIPSEAGPGRAGIPSEAGAGGNEDLSILKSGWNGNLSITKPEGDQIPEYAKPGGDPEERTTEYYKKRPCPALVYRAAQILEEMLEETAQGTPYGGLHDSGKSGHLW